MTSKQFKVVNPSNPVERAPIDWTLCILCQKRTAETLSQPWRGRGRGSGVSVGIGYRSFAVNIGKFKDLGKIPLNVCPDQLNDGSGIEETLLKNSAAWHKTCRNHFSDFKLQRQATRQTEAEDNGDQVGSPVKRRRPNFQAGDVHAKIEPVCFFCGEVAGRSGLHVVSTMGIDKSVRLYATKLRDTELLAKLAPGDMVALEAKYHKKCLSELYNRYNRATKEECTRKVQDVHETFSSYHSIAFAELISYIDEMRQTETTVPVFRLADLVSVYTERLDELSVEQKSYVHPTRLKERLLLHCPYLKAVTKGRNVLLTYDAAVGDAILKACSDNDSEAIQLARAAGIVRKQIFSHGHSFNGSLCEEQSESSVPNTLLALVNMILDGPSIKSQTHKEASSTQAAVTITQLMTFNSIKTTTKPRQSVVRHNSEREVPIPVYLGLKVHVKTRKRELVDCLHKHGLSISYDRVLRISSSLAKGIIARFENDGVVCPPQLKSGLFTTGQVDNIDHNPSAITAMDSFHGTAHSICQHPTEDNPGTDRDKIIFEETNVEKQIRPLPLAYTNILPVDPMPKVLKVPVIHGPMRPGTNNFAEDRKKEDKWLEKQISVVDGDTADVEDFVSWAAYHASSHVRMEKPPTAIALMPLFREASHSFAMILHSMKTNKAATELLNPGQIPVLTMDQPLYAIGKQLQWKFPGQFGEDKYVVMLGPLHIEMAGLKVIGNFIDGSGWSNAIAQANVATKGTADAFIHASHVTKTRRAHQVTAASLYVLQRRAYDVRSAQSASDDDHSDVQSAHSEPDDDHGDVQSAHSELDDDHGDVQSAHSTPDDDYSDVQSAHSELDDDHSDVQSAHSTPDDDHGMQRRAHDESLMNSVPDDDPPSTNSFTEWCKRMRLAQPMFLYWSTVLDLELTVLAYVRALRTSDFDLYVESLTQLVPWFFALDHVHYARWLPVHIRDMATLSQRCPELHEHFMQGAFTSNKTGNAFSAIGLDQAHEQMNACVKGDGGAIGLTEDPGALRRWMVAGPQLSAVIGEYEDQMSLHSDKSGKHHEQSASRQKSFAEDVRALVSTMEEMGNPFLDESADLLTLDSQEIMPNCVTDSIRQIHSLGEKQYTTFIEERLMKNETPISAPIPRNSLPLLSRPTKAAPSKDKVKLTELKSDCALFSRLYISSLSREGNLEEFFRHENQQYPPSLSSAGKLRPGKKSDLVGCLEAKNPSTVVNAPFVEMKVFDGAAVVHLLSVGESKTFKEYAQEVFMPYVSSQLEGIERVDLVWDIYLKDSLKLSTRENRGTGTRRRVAGNVRLPGNWKNFLRNDENKDELFHFLANESVVHDTGAKVIISTVGDSVVCSKLDQKTEGLQPCSQEEADTRIFVHVLDGMNSGLKRLMIRTVDTDIVVLAVAKIHDLSNLDELWIAFGTGKDFRYLPIHDIARALGPQMANGLPFFHAFTGSDTTSYFANYGKKSAWQTWLAYPPVSESFAYLSSPSPPSTSEDVIQHLERFVVLMYNRTSDLMHVDTARMTLFSKMSRSIDNIPPTKAALEEHIKRAAYQAGHVWGQTLQLQPVVPEPTDWGWERKQHGFKPRWTTLPVAEKACQELICCKCTKSCRGNCKCFKAKLECTQLCKCDGSCYEV